MPSIVNPDICGLSPDVSVFRIFTASAFCALVRHARSDTISLSLSTRAMFTSVATLQLYMPILRKLTLLSTNGEEFQNLSGIKLFGDTPLLNVLDTVDIQCVVSVLDLPYGQITHYSTYHVLHHRRFPGPSTINILWFLSETGNLEVCDLRCEVKGASDLVEALAQTCSKLQTLTLSSWAYAYPSSVLALLLNVLTLPPPVCS